MNNQVISRLSGQYAFAFRILAFRVEKDKCTGSAYDGGDLITNELTQKPQRNEVYVSGNLIAAKPDKPDHSEYRLKNYLKNILNVENQCVIFFSL